MPVVVVEHIWVPVIDTRFAMHRIARIVHVEGRLRGRLHRNGLGVQLKSLRGVFGTRIFVSEKVTCVIQDNVLYQIHAPSMQGIGELLVVFQCANMGVDIFKVGGPVAVIAPVLSVPPLVNNGRCNPN